MAELVPDHRTKKIATLLDALFRDVLHEDEPIFVSDEATLLDVSLAAPDDLIRRCSAYYQTTVTAADLRTPLWKVLPELAKRRVSARDR
jgi:hypothetical protein